MIRFLLGFLIGLVAGFAAVWQVEHWLGGQSIVDTGSHVAREARSFGHSLHDTLESLTPESIRRELAATSMVVREKAREAGRALRDATTDARTAAAIKARLFTEDDLPALRIHVDATQGIVTLSGTLPSHEMVGRAVKVALDTEGVTKVISTIQVQPESPPPSRFETAPSP